MDPKTKAKYETSKWISTLLDELQVQVDKDEADAEAIQLTSRKGKNPAAEKLDMLTQRLETHKYHQKRLEIIMRMIDNDALDPEEVNGIQDGITYYIRENQDPDFMDDETLYDDLNLPETFDSDDEHNNDDSDDDDAPVSKRESHKARAAAAKEVEPEPVAPPASASASSASLAAASVPVVNEWANKKRTTSSAGEDEKKSAPVAAPAAAAAAAAPLAAPVLAGSKKAVASVPIPTTAPVAEKAAPLSPMKKGAAAPTVPMQSSAMPLGKAASSTSAVPPTPNFAPVIVPNIAASVVSQKKDGTTPIPLSAVVAAGLPNKTAPSAPTFAGVVAPQKQEVPTAAKAADPFPAIQGSKPTTAAAVAAKGSEPELAGKPELISKAPGASLSPPTAALTEHKEEERDFPFGAFEHGMPPLLADLAQAFRMLRNSNRSEATPAHLAHFDASYQSHQNRAEAPEVDRPRAYWPRNPTPTPAYFPQQPLSGLENPALFSMFDTDTLFFIFYAQSGTYAQYLAARELKRQSWRFHKKHNMWFQRHEEPKSITDDYEQGTYVYFDHETTWSPRKKSDFVFDYRFLEDEQLV